MVSMPDNYNLRRWVLILCLDPSSQIDAIDAHYKHFFNKLSYHAERCDAKSAQSAMLYLAQEIKPRAVIVPDAGLLDPKHTDVLDSLLSYAREGGRVIFCGNFNFSGVTYIEMNNFLENRLCVPWRTNIISFHSRHPLHYKLLAFRNPYFSHADKIYTDISKSFHQKSYYYNGVGPADSVYVVEGFAYGGLAAVAFKPFAEGWIGIVGFPDPGKEVDEVIFSLCGLVVDLDW